MTEKQLMMLLAAIEKKIDQRLEPLRKQIAMKDSAALMVGSYGTVLHGHLDALEACADAVMVRKAVLTSGKASPLMSAALGVAK